MRFGLSSIAERKRPRHVLLLGIVFLVFSLYAAKLVVTDLQLFSIEKALSRWSIEHPPSLQDLSRVENLLARYGREANPEAQLLQVRLLDWQAYSFPSQARFYWMQAETRLQQLTELCPTESIAWAYRASINVKLARLDYAKVFAVRADQLGAGESDTQRVLNSIDFRDYSDGS